MNKKLLIYKAIQKLKNQFTVLRNAMEPTMRQKIEGDPEYRRKFEAYMKKK